MTSPNVRYFTFFSEFVFPKIYNSFSVFFLVKITTWDYNKLPKNVTFSLPNQDSPTVLDFEKKLRMGEKESHMIYCIRGYHSRYPPPYFPPARSAGKFFSKEIPNKKILLQIPPDVLEKKLFYGVFRCSRGRTFFFKIFFHKTFYTNQNYV